jgi:Tfp pilus assembly protein PilV
MKYEYVSMAQQSTNNAVRLMRLGATERALRFFEHAHWLTYFPTDTAAWGCAYTSRKLRKPKAR